MGTSFGIDGNAFGEGQGEPLPGLSHLNIEEGSICSIFNHSGKG